MIIGIGTDIVEIKRIKDALEKYGDRFKNRIFTEIEQKYCDDWGENKYVHYAARFAAKESFSKAIGTGITKGFKFKEIGINNLKTGEPVIELSGGLSDKYKDYSARVSLSHTDNNAIAFVVLEK